MSLITQIDQDIKLAMLAKQADRLQGLRAIKSALLLAKTEKGAADELTEEASPQKQSMRDPSAQPSAQARGEPVSLGETDRFSIPAGQ